MDTLPRPHPQELRDRAYELFAKRIPLARIAESLSIPLDTVRKWSSKGKWKTRLLLTGVTPGLPKDFQPLNTATEDDIDAQLSKLTQLSFSEKQQAYRDLMADEAIRAALSIKNVPSATLVQQADKVKKLDEVARKALRLDEQKTGMIINVALLAQPVVPLNKPAVVEIDSLYSDLAIEETPPEKN